MPGSSKDIGGDAGLGGGVSADVVGVVGGDKISGAGLRVVYSKKTNYGSISRPRNS